MKNIFYKNLKAFTLCAGFFSLGACKEKSIVKPGDLIPPVDNINTFEVNDFVMTIQNSYYDSLRANNYNYPVFALGQIANDAFFGKTAAGVYMQFAPPSADFTFPSDASSIDSVVLVMPYINFSYGDTDRSNNNHALKLKAYEIKDNNFVYTDSSQKWYSPQVFQYAANNPIGSGTVTIKSLTDTLRLANGDTVSGILRLKLNNSLGDFVRSLPSSDLATPAAFISRFNGIFLGPDVAQNQNTLSYFSTTGGSSANTIYQTAHLEFYYHIGTEVASKRAIFPFSSTCAFSNNIQRNYAGTPAESFLNTNANRDSILIEGYPGFRPDIVIKLDGKIPPSIINKATLELTVARTGDETRFNPPTQLIINRINADNTIGSIMDVLDATGAPNTDNLIFLDAKPKIIQINGNDYFRYAINIPREIQRTMSLGETELKLRISTAQVYPGAQRMVALGNGAAEDTRIRLNVIYTKQN